MNVPVNLLLHMEPEDFCLLLIKAGIYFFIWDDGLCLGAGHSYSDDFEEAFHLHHDAVEALAPSVPKDHCIVSAIKFSQSPIESLLSKHMAIYYMGEFAHKSYQVDAQYPIGSYKADFFFRRSQQDSIGLIVECDGHDFHERTKEQASHDKERDREMQKMGHTVFRFTGSDIYKNREKIGREIMDWLRL